MSSGLYAYEIVQPSQGYPATPLFAGSSAAPRFAASGGFFILESSFMSALSPLLTPFTAAWRLALRAPLALLAVLICASLAHATGLNDTGITDCSNDTAIDNASGLQADSGTHPRQDCRYGRDAAAAAGSLPKAGAGSKGFDFTKIANNGSVLPASAVLGTGTTDWACTQDNVTGLIWEVKTTSGLRSQSHSYTWYSSDTATNGGSVGTVSGGSCFATGRCDTEKFVADVNAAGLCGASNWRMPAVKELESIADLGRVNPAIDPTYFPNTPASYFWSASAVASYSNYAWYVYFGYGNASSDNKGFTYRVRLVRAGQ
jgi:hypothetical protein